MKFSVGDPVILKATKKEGIVKELLEDGMYLVDSESVLFPCYDEDLEHPYLQWFLSDKLKNIQSKQETASDAGLADQINAHIDNLKQFQSLKEGLYLSYHPQFKIDEFEEEILSHFHIFLVNKTNYDIQVALIDKEESEELVKVKVYKNDQEFLWKCSVDEFNLPSKWDIQIIWKGNDAKKQKYQSALPLKFPVKKFFGYLPKLRIDRTLHFTQALSIDFELEMSTQNENESTKSMASPVIKTFKKEKDTFSLEDFYTTDAEIDLHMEAIGHHFNKNIYVAELEFQLDYATQKLQEMRQKGIKEVFVIHGVGEGKLKKALHQVLEENINLVESYDHGYFQKYGFGATKVMLW